MNNKNQTHVRVPFQQTSDPVKFLPIANRTITATCNALSASPQKTMVPAMIKSTLTW